MHDVAGIGLEIACRRLLDVGDTFKAGRRPFTQLAQKFQQIADVAAALVEIERVAPTDRRDAGATDTALSLRFLGDTINRNYPVHVPGQIVTVEFDFEV